MDGPRPLRLKRPEAVCGQQTAEFVLLMGLAALVAVSMQLVARRGVQGGLQHVSDTVLGVPNQTNSTIVFQEVHVRQVGSQQGGANFLRVDSANQTANGHSVVHDEKSHIIPNL